MSSKSSARALDGWEVASAALPEYLAWVKAGNFLFASPEWAAAMVALGADVRFAWHSTAQYGVMIPVFKLHGLRVGFLGFPVFGAPWDGMSVAQLTVEASHIARAAKLAIIRVTRCGVGTYDETATAARPEVWIADLQNWATSHNKRVRRDLAFAGREGVGIRITDAHADASAWFALYAKTVQAHAGKLRYTQAYFQQLIGVARSSSSLRIFTALDGSDAVCGFVVLAINGDIAYYLHSAVNDVAKKLGVSDLLMAQLIEHARESGATRLNFMSSPWGQPGLVKYKGKWGDTRALSITYDLGHGLLGRFAKLASSWQSRRDRAAAVQYQMGTDSKLTNTEASNDLNRTSA